MVFIQYAGLQYKQRGDLIRLWKPEGAEDFSSSVIVPPMRLHLSCIVVFEPETKIANFIIFSLGNTVWGSVMRSFFFLFFLCV